MIRSPKLRWPAALSTALMVGAAMVLGTASPAAAQYERDDPVRARIGEPAPDFTLTDLDGKEHKLSDYTAKGQIVVLEWFNPYCPYVQKHHKHNRTMAQLYEEYKGRGVVWLAINSAHEGDASSSRDVNVEHKKTWEIKYPILLDPTGKVGKMYGARTTPHMYVINADGTLVYMGAIDDDRSPDRLGKVNYVREALNAVLAGETVATAETRPYGCTVKYRN